MAFTNYVRPVSAYIPNQTITHTDINSEMDELAAALNNKPDALVRSTFTPALSFATVGDLSVSYAAQSGICYLDERNKVATYIVKIDCTPTFTTASGDARITDLPYAIDGSSDNSGIVSRFKTLSPPSSNRNSLFIDAADGNTYLEFSWFGDGSESTLKTNHFTSAGSDHIMEFMLWAKVTVP